MHSDLKLFVNVSTKKTALHPYAYISQVQTAQRLLRVESEENEQQVAQDGRYRAPEVFGLPTSRGTRMPPAQHFNVSGTCLVGSYGL